MSKIIDLKEDKLDEITLKKLLFVSLRERNKARGINFNEAMYWQKNVNWFEEIVGIRDIIYKNDRAYFAEELVQSMIEDVKNNV